MHVAMASSFEPQGVQDLRAQAAAYQREGRLDEAESIHRRLLDERGEDRASLQFLSARANQRGEYAAAAGYMRRYLTLDPENAEAHRALGQTLETLERPREALVCYGRLLSLAPTDPRTFLLLGHALESCGERVPAVAAASLIESGLDQLLEKEAGSQTLAGLQRRAEILQGLLQSYREEVFEHCRAAVAEEAGESDSEAAARARFDEEMAAFAERRKALVAHPLGDSGEQYAAAFRQITEAPDDVRGWLYGADALDRMGRAEDAAQVASLGEDRTGKLQRGVRRLGTDPILAHLSHKAVRLLGRRFLALHEEAVGADGPARIRNAVWPQTHPEAVAYRHCDQRPHLFYIPDLPAEPIIARERLGWVAELEGQADAIRKEVLAALEIDRDGAPYVGPDYAMGEEWTPLQGSRRWTALHLTQNAERDEEVCERFPRTLAAVERTPVTRIGETPIEVFFSILHPGTHIPPHYGVANSRITVHFPLIVPEGCAIRVSDTHYTWREGEVFAFDDSFDHEAWNHGDRTRIVLIFEAWHPELSEAEIAAIQRSFAARDAWLSNRRLPKPTRDLR